MRVSRSLLREWEEIPEDYTGPIVLNCMEGTVKKLEYQVVKKLDDVNSVSLKIIRVMVDKALGLIVEQK